MQSGESNLARWLKRFFVLSALAVGLLLALPPTKHPLLVKAQGTPPESQKVESASSTQDKATALAGQATQESNSCADCHEKIAQGLSKGVHGKVRMGRALNGNALNGSGISCQTCHGDGVEHIAGGGDASKIKNPAKLKPVEASQTCQQCHAQMKEHANWRGSKHETAGLSCLSCHNVHQPETSLINESKQFASAQAETKLLKMKTEADTCFQCHSDVRKSQFQRSTHLFRNQDREHQLLCSSCHEPHGSIGEKMMRTASVNETCYQCHTEKRGPFLYEHSPVRENCATCHKAHGSNNTALLVARAPMLCQQCHIQGRHQTVAAKPNTAWAFNKACVTCHSAIHGSNHPSGINLQR